DKTIYLRYVPNNNNTFNNCKENGFVIKRIPWDSNILPDSLNFKEASAIVYIKPLAKENMEWRNLIGKKMETGYLYNFLYEQLNNLNNHNDMAFGLAMLACDFDVELANAAGLFYKDEHLLPGQYAYLIQTADNKFSKNIKPAIVIANTSVNNTLKDIDSIKMITRKNEVKLTWNIEQLINDYTGYFIERSVDGETFLQLNVKPYIQIQTQYEKEKINIFYNDTLTEYGRVYFYRVRGLGFFGTYGNYSDIIKCKLIKPLDAFPIADSTHLLYDSILQIHWHMPENFNLNELTGFNIYRSESMEGVYTKLNDELLSKENKIFIDDKPNPSNYYKILALNTYGDSAYSYPMIGLVPDMHPPKIPQNLKGEIDSLGHVILSWQSNKEIDLQGYRIFRNNAVNEELVEISKYIYKDTIYKDTVALETLSEEVFYSITAVDKVYNNSPFSPKVKLKRPDKIKPVEVQFVEVIHNDTSIVLKWISSTSKDVEKYELWRNKGNSNLEKIKEWTAKDSLDKFTDTSLEYGNYYTYQIKVIDDDNNFSISASASHYFDSRIRKQIKQINYKVNLESKSILLNWYYPESDLYSFVIYKAKKGEPLKIIKTLKGNIFSFVDTDLFVGNKYEYCIKANFNSGAESYVSDAIDVDF
ncbi:MAG: fibronectin type III domain-containing protein, partial [Bacteroidetes bacterium]|nr:fibronectin type III domain-containing protein [Bacteroidota bacterium]